MLARFFGILSLPIIAVLVLFNLRRILFTFASFFATSRRVPPLASENLPAVLVLVPCRNEEEMIGGLGRTLDAFEYPREKFKVVLIDDGSRDETRAAMRELARTEPNAHVLALDDSIGKARALNAALAQFPFGEIVYVLDADHRPAPDTLRRMMNYFSDPSVAGVSGRTIPSNAFASPSAYYTTVESMVNQLITMRAKDRLGLAPALLGSNCAYRRPVLNACGNFPPGAFLEDSELTIRLSRAGYQLRFATDAVASQQVPQTVAGYLSQHARWGRGFNEITRAHALALVRQRNVNPLLRAEMLMFALGYLDRLALLGAVLFSLASCMHPRRFRFPRPVLVVALLTPFAQILALFLEQRVGADMWLRLPFVPLFFALDILAALRAFFDSLLNRARVWTSPERVPDRSAR